MADVEQNITVESGGRVLLRGDWLRRKAPLAKGSLPLSGQGFLDSVGLKGVTSISLVDAGIKCWDSTLLIFVSLICADAKAKGMTVDLSALPHGIGKMMTLSNADNTGGQPKDNSNDIDEKLSTREQMVLRAGYFGLGFHNTIRRIAAFIGSLVIGALDILRGHSRMRCVDFLRELVTCGMGALPIIVLISFLMGLIMAFIGAIPLKWFQAEVYVASLVGIGMLRLLAPVMVGIVMAGRTSASYAAELGTMTVNEEVDALQTMGIPSVDFLVMPRFLSMSLMMPLLCVFADIVSIFGGAAVAVFYLNISPLAYFTTLAHTTRLNDFFVGLVTCFILGMLDAMCGCYHGINCGRSAAAVGQATTAAVVYSIVCIVVATSLITIATVVLKI